MAIAAAQNILIFGLWRQVSYAPLLSFYVSMINGIIAL